jgi:AcrR family transcriptional regulator
MGGKAKATDKRARLVESVVKLVYEQGFEETSLADIAKDPDVPLGNVYYNFKTKDELGDACSTRSARPRTRRSHSRRRRPIRRRASRGCSRRT